MKYYLSAFLAATVLATLTACGGSAQTAPSTSSSGPTQSALSLTVPDVAGTKFQETRGTVLKEFKVTIVGSDGQKWTSSYPDKTVGILSTDPAAGTVTGSRDLLVKLDVTENEMEESASAARATAQAAAKEAADAAELANRYRFTCGPNPYSTTGVNVYSSLKEVWASKHYARSDTCTTQIDGVYADSKPAVLPSEQAIVDVVASSGGDASGAPAQTFDKVLRLCAKPPADFADQVYAKPEWKKAQAKAALALCPDAPHAAMLQEVVTAVKVSDGTHIVGKEMDPGTYRTKTSAKDCYWSRTTGGGSVIANDFVGFAPDGVTVTVYSGEGFESQRCGVWTKIG
ncbi:hypothetical protein NMQ03_09555 [Arthrobacter sp. DNA4]|uniref:hypothetical protein n=1 Tax=Arthrobacter sp. DNA4 TaxID=2963432 RepID=UPI0020CCB2CB|nr:hypothetical protein [Arthrobacter sp. DNA4]UTT71297.1 hypothetical protein NMQ03_09555 [Arthrobacter sp. DNA4]